MTKLYDQALSKICALNWGIKDPDYLNNFSEIFVTQANVFLHASLRKAKPGLNFFNPANEKHLIELMDRQHGPYHRLFTLTRKMLIMEKIENAVAKGVTQILLFGNGFDPDGMHTAKKYPHVKVIEIDDPQVLKVKRHIVNNYYSGIVITDRESNICHVMSNLNYTCFSAETPDASLRNSLLLSGFDQAQKTLLIDDNFLMQENIRTCAKFLLELRSVLHAESELMVSMQHKNGSLKTAVLFFNTCGLFVKEAMPNADILGIQNEELGNFIKKASTADTMVKNNFILQNIGLVNANEDIPLMPYLDDFKECMNLLSLR